MTAFECPVRGAVPLPPQACLQWNHSVLQEPDFKAPWQALQDAFHLHQELHPGDFDHSGVGVVGLSPPRLRHCRPLQVQFHERITLHFGNEYEPIGKWDTFELPLRSSVASTSWTDEIALWKNRKVVLPDADPLSLAVCISGEQALDPHLHLRSAPQSGDTICDWQCGMSEIPFMTHSIMDAFVQLARLPADDGDGHAPNPGGQPPDDRRPDFTDNMLDRIDPVLFPASNLETFGLTVRTWYIHHVHHVRHAEPRLLHLEGERTTWADQLRAAWHGLWNPDEPTAFTLPTPMPVRHPTEQFIALDIILSQGLQELRYSGLVTTQFVDEGDGLSQTTVAAFFGTHVSGTQIVAAAEAHQYCAPSSGRACSIFFGWVPILLDHHPGHRMRPGHSFVIQVPRDPQLATGQPEAAAVTSSSVIAHGLPAGQVEQHHAHGPPGDDPEHPDGDPPSTPSSWHPGGSAGPMFNCHIYRLRHPPLHLFMRNAAGVPMLNELARSLQVVPASLLHAHAVHVQMIGELRMDWSFIIQSINDLPSASSDALVILDVEVHFHPLAGPVQPLPASTRRVCRMPQFVTREAVLRYGGVSRYCRLHQDRCLVQFNNEAWPLSHRGPQLVRHGVYLRVIVPPPDDGGNTLHAIHIAEQAPLGAVPVPSPVAAPGPTASSTSPAPPSMPDAPAVFRPNFEPEPVDNWWHSQLKDVFAEHAVTEHEDEGSILYVWTWMINHETFQYCAHPRIVRLDQMDHLWLHDLYEPWRDVLQSHVVTDLRLLHPRPPHASHTIDTVHMMIEQNPREPRAAGVISALFHGPHDDRLLQSAYSLPRWLCIEDIVDVLRLNHVCEVQRCTAHAGVATFDRFIRHDIPSGISIELHVRHVECLDDAGAASSHEQFVPRRTMPVASQSLLQRGQVVRRASTVHVEKEPHGPEPLRIDDLVQPSQFTFIDCQRPLFLRAQLLQNWYIDCDQNWQHVWWHPISLRALRCIPALRHETIYGVTLYVDGSSLRKESSAAAGVVLIYHTADGLRWGGFASAPCLGCSTAPRAEATAILLALSWILQMTTLHQSSTIWFEIAFDCMHTAQIAQGCQAAKSNCDLHITIRALVQWIESRIGRVLHWRHIPGHCGDPWNEAADTICRTAAQTGRFTTSLDVIYNVCTFDTQDFFSIQWLWLIEKSLQGDCDAPVLHGHWWRFDVSAPLSCSPAASLHPAVRRRREVDNSPTADATTLRVATANVLTLFPAQQHASGFLGARAEDLAAQFHSAGLHFVGLQETRAKVSGHTTLGHFHVLSSAATSRGQGGIQLWVNRAISTSQGSICMTEHDLHILHATSRRLLVRCAYPGLRLLILVLHAPCEEDEDTLQSFWDATSNVIPAAYRDWMLCVLMDANSRVGSVTSPAIGPHQADDENLKGSYLHSWLLQHELFLPQSFDECHAGPGVTWTHPKGSSARLDFIAVPSNLAHGQVRSWVNDAIDITLNRADHACVCADLTIACHVADRRPRGERLYSTPISPTSFRWNTDVHTHAASLQIWLQHHDKPRHPWRKQHLSDGTKQMILAKRFHWKRLSDVRRHFFRALLRHMFDAWRGRPSCSSDLRPWLSQCERLLAWHRWAYDDLSTRVVTAVRDDDRAFYEQLAASAGDAAEQGPNSLWNAIRHVLPRWRNKRKANLRCVGPSLQDQFSHYDALEAGHSIDYEDLLATCHASQQATLPEIPVAIDLRDLPSRRDIETLGCQMHLNKASGIDAVSMHSLHHACVHSSSWMHQLFFKMWILGIEPLQGKGGLLHAIAKKEASQRIEGMRGIMLIDGIAKLAHSFLRRQFLPVLQRLRHPLQLGGFPRSSTMFATAYVRAFTQLAARRAVSSAIVFIDIKSAFHAMIREIVLGGSGSLHPVLQTVLQQAAADVDGVHERMHQAPDLEQLGLPVCAARLLRDAHQHTWYTLGASDQIHQTERGSRPGSPLADVAFNGLMALVLQELQQRLDCHLPLQAAFAVLEIPASPVAWVDDLAVPVASIHAEHLVAVIQWVMDTVIEICSSFGLQLNLKPHKTEVVPSFRGPGAAEARRLWLVERRGHIPLPSSSASVHFVPHYEHLGAFFQADAGIAAEIRHRTRKAQLAFRQVRRPILLNRHLPASTRLRLLESLVLPVMLHGAGNWPLLSPALLRQLTAPYMKWVRTIAGDGFWTPDQSTDMHLQFLLECPSLPLRLAKMRLLFAFHFFKDAPRLVIDFVTSIATEPSSWFYALRHALAWVASMDAAFFPAQPFEVSVDYICKWIQDNRAHGPGRVRRLYRRALHQGRVVGSAWTAHYELQMTLQRGGVRFPSGSSTSSTTSSDSDLHSCRWCGNSFPTPRQLQNHLWTAHGEASEERLFMTSVTCAACQTCFWTVNRLQIHLRSSRAHPGGCFERLTWTTSPLRTACLIEDMDETSQHVRLPATPVPTALPFALATCHDRATADRRWTTEWRLAGINFDLDPIIQQTFFTLFDDIMLLPQFANSVDPDPLLWALTACAGDDVQRNAPEGAGAWSLALWTLDAMVYARFSHFDSVVFERSARAVFDAVQQLPIGQLVLWRRRMIEAYRPEVDAPGPVPHSASFSFEPIPDPVALQHQPLTPLFAVPP